MTVTRTESPRKVLSDQIEMLQGAIAHARSLGEEPTARQIEVLARYQAELTDMIARGAGAEAREVGQVDNPVPLHKRPQAGSAASNQFGTFEVKYATAKQVGFIKHLLETRNLASLANSAVFDLPRLREAVLAGKVNKRAASDAITRLLACPEATPVLEADEAPKAARPASDKQVALIKRLAAERNWNDGQAVLAHPMSVVADVVAGVVVEGRDASAAIDLLFGCAKAVRPVAASAAAAEALEMGMYRTQDGTMYRVYPAKNGGHLLAKRLVQVDGGWEFEYAGAAGRFVAASDRMSLEEAKAWGAQFGTCCVCAALLTDPTSVAKGIGPVCESRV